MSSVFGQKRWDFSFIFSQTTMLQMLCQASYVHLAGVGSLALILIELLLDNFSISIADVF